MINPVWLRSFCTLVDVGHFTKTAERLHMTQSGVSQHVRKLEEQLAQTLLNRYGKQFTLTEAGERLYRQGGEILHALTELEIEVGENPAFEGVVRIASPGSIGLKLYRHLLLLQQAHPKLIIDYRFAPNNEIDRLISEQLIDIGFMTRQANLSEVKIEEIADEALMLITPADGVEPSWSRLLELGFIHHPDGEHHANLLLSANYPEFQHIKQFRNAGFSNQIALILEPVSLGLGFTVLPAHAVAAFHDPEAIAAHRLNVQVSEPLYLAQHKNKLLPKRVNSVVNHALTCL